MKSKVLFLTCAILTVSIYASEQIDDKNWEQHPEVKLIRSMFNDINALQKAGKLKKIEKRCDLYDGSVVIVGEIFTNQNSIVRKYVVDGETDDSRSTAEYYYSEHGVPRFTYRFRGAYNGTEVKERIYFDVQGKHLYTNRTSKGPGYNPSHLTDFVTNPKADYADICKE